MKVWFITLSFFWFVAGANGLEKPTRLTSGFVPDEKNLVGPPPLEVVSTQVGPTIASMKTSLIPKYKDDNDSGHALVQRRLLGLWGVAIIIVKVVIFFAAMPKLNDYTMPTENTPPTPDEPPPPTPPGPDDMDKKKDNYNQDRYGRGDPHMNMWDGTKYNFFGRCDVVAASFFVPGYPGVADLHLRTAMFPEWNHTVISNAALRFGDEVLEVDNQGNHFVNGEANDAIPTKFAGVTLAKENATDGSITIKVEMPEIKFQFTNDEADETIEYKFEDEFINFHIIPDEGFLNVQVGTIC